MTHRINVTLHTEWSERMFGDFGGLLLQNLKVKTENFGPLTEMLLQRMFLTNP